MHVECLHPASVQQAAVGSGLGKRERVFPELLGGPLCSRPRAPSEPLHQQDLVCVCTTAGNSGWPPFAPFLQEKRGGGGAGVGGGPAKASKELKCFSLSFGHLMRRTDSEETLMLGKIEGGRRRG